MQSIFWLALLFLPPLWAILTLKEKIRSWPIYTIGMFIVFLAICYFITGDTTSGILAAISFVNFLGICIWLKRHGTSG